MKRNTMYDFEKEIWCGMTSYYILSKDEGEITKWMAGRFVTSMGRAKKFRYRPEPFVKYFTTDVKQIRKAKIGRIKQTIIENNKIEKSEVKNTRIWLTTCKKHGS
jgi:hypothetical protein